MRLIRTLDNIAEAVEHTDLVAQPRHVPSGPLDLLQQSYGGLEVGTEPVRLHVGAHSSSMRGRFQYPGIPWAAESTEARGGEHLHERHALVFTMRGGRAGYIDDIAADTEAEDKFWL